MAFVARFTPQSMNTDQYDEIVRKLEEAGAGKPQGRLYHICYGAADQLSVLDIWESEETFRQFGQVLMPIAQQVGVDPGPPDIQPVHNTIAG